VLLKLAFQPSDLKFYIGTFPFYLCLFTSSFLDISLHALYSKNSMLLTKAEMAPSHQRPLLGSGTQRRLPLSPRGECDPPTLIPLLTLSIWTKILLTIRVRQPIALSRARKFLILTIQPGPRYSLSVITWYKIN